MARHLRLLVALSIILLSLSISLAWPIPICNTNQTQTSPGIAETGSGGCFVAFTGLITAPPTGLPTAFGTFFSQGGVLINPAFECADSLIGITGFATHGSSNPRLVYNGDGFLIAIEETRPGTQGDRDIFAQRTGLIGGRAWGPQGVAVCTATNDQQFAQQTYGAIALDGSGGCYIVWEDPRLGLTNYDVYLQHLTSSGAVASGIWPSNGLRITTASGNQRHASVIADGAGGAIVVWQDEQTSGNANIYATRLQGDGNPVMNWNATGNLVCGAISDQTLPVLTSDGSNGAIIAWADGRGSDIYAQRMQGDATAAWATDGVAITTAASVQTSPEIVQDGLGGAWIAWMDTRTMGNGQDVYAQYVTSTGMTSVAGDVAVSTATSDQSFPRIVSDEFGGAIICWTDKRTPGPFGTNVDIYAQRVLANGSTAWTADGAAVGTATGLAETPVIASDGGGGAVIAWRDLSADSNGDILVARFRDGAPYVAVEDQLPVLGGLVVVPNPAVQWTEVRLAPSTSAAGNLTVHDLTGRVVRHLATIRGGYASAATVRWNLADDRGVRVAPGVYWIRGRVGGERVERSVVVLE